MLGTQEKPRSRRGQVWEETSKQDEQFMFRTPWWPNSDRRAVSGLLSNLSPDRAFCLAYKRGGEVWGRPVSVSLHVRFRPTHPPAPVARIPVRPGPPIHATAKPAGVQRCAAWPHCPPPSEPYSKPLNDWGHECQGAISIQSTSMLAAACECGVLCSV
jgi:hypothetical protein